jgi:hypothetical protein
MLFIFSFQRFLVGMEGVPRWLFTGLASTRFPELSNPWKTTEVDGLVALKQFQRMKYLQTTEEAGIEKGATPHGHTTMIRQPIIQAMTPGKYDPERGTS